MGRHSVCLRLEAVRAGGVRIVCLTGEPGTGKTTLLEHFISGLQNTAEQLVTFSACSQRLAGVEAFLPLLDGLDGLTRAGQNAVVTRLLKLTAPTWYVQIAPLWSTADPHSRPCRNAQRPPHWSV